MLDSIYSFLAKIMIAAWVIVTPIHATIFAIGFLVFSDLILGVMAAKKEKQKITSAGIRRTVVKLFLYQVGLVLAFVVESYLTLELIPIVKILACLIGITEIHSVFENLNRISGTNMFDKILKALRSKNDKL